MKKFLIGLSMIVCFGFGVFALMSATCPAPVPQKPTMTKTVGGFGSNLTVYEYRDSDGALHVIVQGNGEAGPVAITR